jgi:hypothetical protein
LDPLDIGRGGERDGTDDEDNDLENGDDVPDDDVEQDFTVGPKRRKVIRIIKARIFLKGVLAVSKLAFYN